MERNVRWFYLLALKNSLEYKRDELSSYIWSYPQLIFVEEKDYIMYVFNRSCTSRSLNRFRY